MIDVAIIAQRSAIRSVNVTILYGTGWLACSVVVHVEVVARLAEDAHRLMLVVYAVVGLGGVGAGLPVDAGDLPDLADGASLVSIVESAAGYYLGVGQFDAARRRGGEDVACGAILASRGRGTGARLVDIAVFDVLLGAGAIDEHEWGRAEEAGVRI